MKNMDL